jgi:stage II sporulation protein M
MAKKQKKKFNLKTQYKESWDFIKENKSFIYAIIGIFLIFTLIGFFVPVPESVMKSILAYLQELFSKTNGMSQINLIGFIFLNNLQSSFFGLIFGVMFGIFPIVSSLINGYMLGFVASMAVRSEGITVLWRILPHGIFELPAVFISLGMGLRLGSHIFNRKKENFGEILIKSLKVFFTIVVPLLIIAAIIEGTLIALS